MIIKFIPETEAEKEEAAKNNIEEVVHYNVKEFLVFGNKIDEEGDMSDFHEWKGSYRYLLGSMEYFSNVINDSRRENELGRNKEARHLKNMGMIKQGTIGADLKVVDTEGFEGDENEGDEGDEGDEKTFLKLDDR